MPPTNNASTNDDRCVVEGKSVGTMTDEFGMDDYKSPTERSGAYNASMGQCEAVTVPIVSRRIVFKFTDEEIWVGANGPPLNDRMTGMGESMSEDRRVNAAAAAAARLTPDTSEQQQTQQQQQQQHPSGGAYQW